MDFHIYNTKKKSELRLQFYIEHPSYIVPLEKIEELAIERLKVLRCIETVGQDYIKGSKEYHMQLINQLNRCSQLGKSFTFDSDMDPTKSIKNDIKNDKLSQFILALAYCRTEDLTRWFLQQEIDLFRFRFTIEANHDPKTIERFRVTNKIMLIPASEIEIAQIKKEYSLDFEEMMMYKVRWEEVPDLVKKLRCCVVSGFVYVVSVVDISSVVMSRLRIHLSRTLVTLRANLTTIDEDDRLRPLLSTLNKRYLGKQYDGQINEKMTAAQIPFLSKKSFPPCMEQIHVTLMRDNHLKHAARMQYGLFLKGIGLPLEESLKFWNGAFQPRIDGDTFAKKYAYNIRHNYGQEGKRISYTPYSCVKIITTAAINECCGCPFQKMDVDLMAQRLKSSTKATPEQIESIVGKMKNKHYQISCRDYFNVVHDLPIDYPVTINHPNQYFEESQKIAKDNSKAAQ